MCVCTCVLHVCVHVHMCGWAHARVCVCMSVRVCVCVQLAFKSVQSYASLISRWFALKNTAHIGVFIVCSTLPIVCCWAEKDLYSPLSLHAVSLLYRWLWQELMQKEVEYVSLSRDTTESDLKQRREIKDGTAEYIHQVHVCARMRVHAFGSVCSVGVHNCDCVFMCLYVITYALYWFLHYTDRTSHCAFEVSLSYSSFSPVTRVKTLSA